MSTAPKATSALNVVDRLRQDIVDGEFAPGTRLVTAELARRYETSAMPVRSALQVLQVEGFVVYSPHRGASVRPLDADYVEQLYDVRMALTAMLLPKVVRHVSQAHLERAEGLLEEFETLVQSGDMAGAMRANAEFHRLIYSVAGNAPALEMLERSWMILDALRARFGFGEGRLKQSDQGHRKLIAALQARNADEAISVAMHYAEMARADLVGRLEKGEATSTNTEEPI